MYERRIEKLEIVKLKIWLQTDIWKMKNERSDGLHDWKYSCKHIDTIKYLNLLQWWQREFEMCRSFTHSHLIAQQSNKTKRWLNNVAVGGHIINFSFRQNRENYYYFLLSYKSLFLKIFNEIENQNLLVQNYFLIGLN